MKLLKISMILIVYLFFLPYIILVLGFEMLKNIVLESINYFKNINI